MLPIERGEGWSGLGYQGLSNSLILQVGFYLSGKQFYRILFIEFFNRMDSEEEHIWLKSRNKSNCNRKLIPKHDLEAYEYVQVTVPHTSCLLPSVAWLHHDPQNVTKKCYTSSLFWDARLWGPKKICLKRRERQNKISFLNLFLHE